MRGIASATQGAMRSLGHLPTVLLLGAITASQAQVEPMKYLLVSIPGERQIGYFTLPDTGVYNILLVGGGGGPASPSTICVDQTNSRLFVADIPTQKIYWYQLIQLPDGKLITDGRQQVAVESVEAKWLAVDGVGNLYYTGKQVVLPGTPGAGDSSEAIFKHDTIALATNDALSRAPVWTNANTGSPNARVGSAPSGITTDNFDLFWANGEKGKEHGAVVKAPISPPEVSPGSSVQALADNTDEVRGVVLTPTSIFYASADGIFGIPKSKETAACGDSSCMLLAKGVKPTGLVWDGDGTVYFSDPGATPNGAVFTFPSNGPLAKHKIERLVDVNGIYGIDMFEVEPPPKYGVSGFLEQIGLR